MITVRYSSIDRFSESRKFKTLTGARAYAQKWVGEHPDLGSGYAISGDGVGKITVSGVSLAELFGVAKDPDDRSGDFAIFRVSYHEDYGTNTMLVARWSDEYDAIMSLDALSQSDDSDWYHYGASWEGDRWVKWAAPTYNGKTAAEIMAETYPDGPF